MFGSLIDRLDVAYHPWLCKKRTEYLVMISGPSIADVRFHSTKKQLQLVTSISK